MVAALDLGSSVSRRGGSSPFVRTNKAEAYWVPAILLFTHILLIMKTLFTFIISILLTTSIGSFAAEKDLPLPTAADSIRDKIWLEQTFVNYLNLLPHAHQENLQEIADDFLNHIASKGNLDEAERGRAAFWLVMAMKNRQGTTATDFIMETREGKERSLLETLKDGDNIVLFYDPDCNHCAEVIQYLRDTPAFSEVNVVAIDSEEDRYLWDATKYQLPENWTVGYALDPIQETELYDFPEMPTIYLLDKDGTILLKEASIENLINRLQ